MLPRKIKEILISLVFSEIAEIALVAISAISENTRHINP